MILDMQKDEWHLPPATAHNYGGTLSFADGHVEYKRWLEDTTKGIAWHSSWNIGPHKTPVKAGDRDFGLDPRTPDISTELIRTWTRNPKTRYSSA